jgi:hypothetical protein
MTKIYLDNLSKESSSCHNEHMSYSLADILRSKDFDEPAESTAIKQYVQANFNESVEVIIREKQIIIGVRSAALAGTLRMRTPEIQQSAQTTKRLVFRIR